MAKNKFRITEETTVDDAEQALHELEKLPARTLQHPN